MCLSLPTHKLISRVAASRGLTLSDTVYAVFRDELRLQEDGNAWQLAPEPFVVRPTYEEGECLVLLWHPFLPTVKLARREATALADALRVAADGDTPEFELVSDTGKKLITLSRGGRHIGLHVDTDHVAMVRPVASDVADALISASVHAGPIPEGGPI